MSSPSLVQLISSWGKATANDLPTRTHPEHPAIVAEFLRPHVARNRNRRADFALSTKTKRFAHAAPCVAGTFRLSLPRSHRMDRPQTRPAADQYLRAGDLLPDVPAGTHREVSSQSLPHAQLRAGWGLRI